jgi:AcrR family transcriptional regulator
VCKIGIVPATKRLQDREEKRDELVTAARRLFIEDGYEATSMAKLAKAGGVAANTIYWYFADKDDLLIAVLNAVMSDAWSQYQDVAARPFEEQLLWVVGQLRQTRRLVTTVHARIGLSAGLNAWHDTFHAMAEGLLRSALAQTGATRSNLDAAVKIGVFTIEGLLTHDLDEKQQQAICRRLAMQTTPL